jgi:hypothetical protein
MLQKNFSRILFGLIFLSSVFAVSAQVKARKPAEKPAQKTRFKPKPETVEETPTQCPHEEKLRVQKNKPKIFPEPVKKNAHTRKQPHELPQRMKLAGLFLRIFAAEFFDFQNVSSNTTKTEKERLHLQNRVSVKRLQTRFSFHRRLWKE